MNIGIYKYATRSTILDVGSALNYHKINKRNEEEYKGSIVLTINQYTQDKILKSNLPKATAKMLLQTIANHSFARLFNNGYTNYGGSVANKISRITSIKFDSDQMKYIFQIDEGVGRLTKTGAVTMANKQKSVIAFVPYEETLKMAYETLDFINQAETVAMMNGKPLYTIKPKYNPQDRQQLERGQMHG